MIPRENDHLAGRNIYPCCSLGQLILGCPCSFLEEYRQRWPVQLERTSVITPGFCFRGCRRPVSLKVGGRQTVADNGSSSSEFSTTADAFLTTSRSGISFSSDYAIDLEIRRGPTRSRTSFGPDSWAAFSSASLVSLKNLFSLSGMCD